MAKSKDSGRDFSSFGFFKTFILPGLLIFLVPVASYLFFWHAQERYNSEARKALLREVQGDDKLSQEDRAKAIEFINAVPASELAKHKETAVIFPDRILFDLATFRWAIWLSALSIVGGIAVLLFTGICVLLSLHSNVVQYLTLSAGWHILRIYGALQAVVQGALLVALSYWVTALWLEKYWPKLIFGVAILALCAVAVLIHGIFKRFDNRFEIEGTLLAPQDAAALWNQLRMLAAKVGTRPPDQVVAGIDDNFFVTEQTVTVAGQPLHGRTLYVSLALLKQLNGDEADAVLAHELGHFSGRDTVYSKRITPLLARYGNYLEALQQGGLTLPIFYFMLCFRALFELSLRRLGRQREHRADAVAAQATSQRAFAAALLRIVAYSKYRRQIEQDLFDEERPLQSADIGGQVERGFPAYAATFAMNPTLDEDEVPHPFDTHPPLTSRLERLGVKLTTGRSVAEILAAPGDGHWYHNIDGAVDLERQQWEQFEAGFRKFHEETLPYRFLPDTDEERAIVVTAFPPVCFTGKAGQLTLDHEQMQYSSWPGPLLFGEIEQFTMDDSNVLSVRFAGGGKQVRQIKMKEFGKSQQEVIDAINRYYGRYCAAREYQKHKAASVQQEVS